MVIGLMSGTSLDGLDMAFCEFKLANGQWQFTIVVAETQRYSEKWTEKLNGAPLLKTEDLGHLNLEYGRFIGEIVNDFALKYQLHPNLICSHGHTIFHQPNQGITYQLGSGKAISEITQKTVVSNFRALDVSLGGQGAPLVPIGDMLLFSDYAYCLNLGGFGNISFDVESERISFDVCPVNMALNEISRQSGMEYDKNGENAAKGNVDSQLLNKLNELPYYTETHPKSLSREWYDNNLSPLIKEFHLTLEDKLRTLCEHIAIQVAKVLDGSVPDDKLLISGGGVHNRFLIDRINSRLNLQVIVPDELIIDYKEAMIFGFLGVLRVRNEINCLKSVTGAQRDCSGGEIHKFGG